MTVKDAGSLPAPDYSRARTLVNKMCNFLMSQDHMKQ